MIISSLEQGISLKNCNLNFGTGNYNLDFEAENFLEKLKISTFGTGNVREEI